MDKHLSFTIITDQLQSTACQTPHVNSQMGSHVYIDVLILAMDMPVTVFMAQSLKYQ